MADLLRDEPRVPAVLDQMRDVRPSQRMEIDPVVQVEFPAVGDEPGVQPLAAHPQPAFGGPGGRVAVVDDQDKALRLYTETLGFTTKDDVPVGEDRWITVVSPQHPDGPELLLEPDTHPAVRPFKEALVADGIPATSFAVTDVAAEHERLQSRGVVFTQPPLDLSPIVTAVFDDTCGI